MQTRKSQFIIATVLFRYTASDETIVGRDLMTRFEQAPCDAARNVVEGGCRATEKFSLEAERKKSSVAVSSSGTARAAIWPLVICIYLCAAIFATPVGVTIVDEISYFSEAEVIRNSEPLLEASSYRPSIGEERPHYPLGWPLVLAPTIHAPWPAPFVVPVALHLFGTYLFARLLRRRSLSSLWALLYFAQPASLLFSRTLMAESLSSVLTIALLLAAVPNGAGWLGFLTASSLLVKPSLALAAFPFTVGWLLFEVPIESRRRAAFLAAAGAVLPFLLWVWLLHVGIGGAAGYSAYVRGLPSIRHAALVMGTLAVAWPLLPLGLVLARPAERVGAIGATACLIFFQYDYVGPSPAATLVVGSRLLLPVILLLLPGYAALLSALPMCLKRATVVALVGCGLAFPVPLMEALANRRQALDDIGRQTRAELRTSCLAGYTPFAVKLLVPFPKAPQLASVMDEPRLRAALLDGECVDLIAPETLPTTLEGYFEDPGYFRGLLEAFPHCSLERPGAERILRLFPKDRRPHCDW
jgi:hypothetical protein